MRERTVFRPAALAAGLLGLGILPGALLGGLLAPAAASAAGSQPRPSQPHLEASAGITYLEGDFGTGRSSQIHYAPFQLRYRAGRTRLKLTVPYLAVRTEGVILSGGTVVGTRDTGQATARAGLGDVWLEVRHILLQGRGTLASVAPYAKVKFATASRDKGLGTGENDYEVGLALQHRLGSRAFPFLQAGYRFVGKPAGYRLRDIALYRGGVSWIAGRRHVLTGMVSGRQASQARLDDALDLILAWNYEHRPGKGWQIYLDKGLSSGSPDLGMGVSASWRF